MSDVKFFDRKIDVSNWEVIIKNNDIKINEEITNVGDLFDTVVEGLWYGSISKEIRGSIIFSICLASGNKLYQIRKIEL